jgi:hypothetical protein
MAPARVVPGTEFVVASAAFGEVNARGIDRSVELVLALEGKASGRGGRLVL